MVTLKVVTEAWRWGLARHSIVVISPPERICVAGLPAGPGSVTALCAPGQRLRYSTTADRALPCVKQPVAAWAGQISRLAAAGKLAETLGVTVKQAFWTLGQYDMVVIIDGPEEACAAYMYKIGSLGNIRSTTLRGFTADEMQRIVARIP